MIIDLDQLKTLVEAGDKTALETHIYKALEKGDVSKALATNAAVKSDLDSEKDKHHNTALETWKSNNLQGLIDDAVKQANPTETPEQKRIRELEEKIANGEKSAQRAQLKSKALEFATENGLPPKFSSKYIERFLGDDETTTTATLSELKADLESVIQEGVDSKFKDNGRTPPPGGSGSHIPGSIKTIEQMAAEHNIRNKQ